MHVIVNNTIMMIYQTKNAYLAIILAKHVQIQTVVIAVMPLLILDKLMHQIIYVNVYKVTMMIMIKLVNNVMTAV